jgi:hypothetical protein
MTDRLVLTATEAAFLLDGESPDAAGRAARLLALPQPCRDPAVSAIGLGSLVLRALAVPVADGRVELSPTVTAVAAGLLRPRAWVEVALVSADGAASAVLFDAPPVRFLVAPRPFGCLEFAGVDTGVTVAAALTELAVRHVDRFRPSIVSYRVGVPGAGGGAVTVAAGADDAWTFAVGDDPDEAVHALDRAVALGRLEGALTALLDPALTPRNRSA